MSNLLAAPSLWSIVTNWGGQPLVDSGAWTGSGYNFPSAGFFGTFAMATEAQPGEIKGTFVTDEFGSPDSPVQLVIFRTSDEWPDTYSPPTLTNGAVQEIYYQEQASLHEVDLVIEATEGYIWIGVYEESTASVDRYTGLKTIAVEATPPGPTGNYYVYEMERGWSFDGAYIPHYVELNWLFQEDPFTYSSIQKVRVHGLAKGMTKLQVSMAGMQPDPIADYTADYSAPQWLDLPYTPMHVSEDFANVTHYVDYSDRGLALLMKFEGRNTDLTKPEPAHVLQVLALQGSPQGNGARSN